jgi:hypothetical protein
MQNHITINNLEQEMKAQVLAKRTIVAHEEKRLTMKHTPQKLAPSLAKPRTIHKSLKMYNENLLQSPNPSYEIQMREELYLYELLPLHMIYLTIF